MDNVPVNYYQTNVGIWIIMKKRIFGLKSYCCHQTWNLTLMIMRYLETQNLNEEQLMQALDLFILKMKQNNLILIILQIVTHQT